MDCSETTHEVVLPPEPAGRFAPVPARPWLALGLALWALSFPLIILTIDPVGSRAEPIPFSLDSSLDGAKKAPSAMTMLATRVLLGILVAGASVSAVLALSCIVFPETRRRLKVSLVADRPAPAVRFADLLLAFLVMKILSQLSALIYLGTRGADASSGERVLVSLAMQLPFYVLTILVIVTMARVRGGPDGAAGVWPFWRTPGLACKPVRDATVGVGGFLLSFWVLVALSLCNKWVLSLVGVGQDQNPIISVLNSELNGPQRYWVAAMVVFSVVVMAPIAEEVLFRGLLYNFLRRYLDRWTAACAGALLFSFVHGVLADQWALFALGLLLTWVYERTGRLLPAVVLHAANNSIAIAYLLITQL